MQPFLCVAISQRTPLLVAKDEYFAWRGSVVLRISLISVNGEPLARPVVADFGEAGGGIGRDERNQLALPDPERRLSRVQALVRYERNHYCLVDQGATPTAVNGIPLTKGSSLKLRGGDLIDAAGFRLRVDYLESSVASIAPPAPVSANATQLDHGAHGRPWGYEEPALGVLSEPAPPMSSAAIAAEKIIDPFDELLAADPAQTKTGLVLESLESRVSKLVEVLRPESLERLLDVSGSTGVTPRDEVWGAYRDCFPAIRDMVKRELLSKLDAERFEARSDLIGNQTDQSKKEKAVPHEN